MGKCPIGLSISQCESCYYGIGGGCEYPCSKVNTCPIITSLKDRDWAEAQFTEAVKEKCASCKEREKMTLDQAIKIKEDTLYHRYLHHPEQVEKADKLSIEALRRVTWHKKQHPHGYYELLPGETEE